MRSLFSKLLFSFWLALLVTVLVLVLTQRYWLPGSALPGATAMQEYAEEIAQLQQEEGFGSVMGYLRSLSREQDLHFFLLNPGGDSHRGRRPPPDLRERLERILKHDSDTGSIDALRFRRTSVTFTDGQARVLLAIERSRGLQDLPTWIQLLVALAVTGTIAALLALSLSVPIRRIRRATQALAAGDLSSRVDVPVRGGDELAALGRDFNSMAKRLQALLATREELLRNISHELRSPLARLQVALELLRRNGSDQAESYLQRMERDIERLDTLIGQVMELSRLESGAQRRQDKVDMLALLTEVCDDARFEAGYDDKAVTLQADFTTLKLDGDRELLRSALDNIVRNALRYTPAGSRVEVQANKHSKQLDILFRDAGPGIPEDQLEAVFQPFVRVSEARERESGGHGLGLAIVQRAVAAHGGEVAARNLPDGGLEVKVVLPLGR